MLISWIPVLVILFLCLDSTKGLHGQSKDVFLRDSNSPAASPSPGNTAPLTTSGSAAETGHAGGTGQTNSTTTASSHTASTLMTSTISATGAATSTLAANASTEILSIDDGSLPLPPEITPALALAGAFLMLSGVIYTLIGIKNKTIHIFISTAYLIALAITVLLVYVIEPPISNAIQGAYFVAAFVPAVGLGGVSLIFKDVTEGLGSAAGGFALSMWFLVLKPGGTLTNTAGKAVFIGCWTAGVYIIYFSHHVRSYVIIGATSFAGATAVIIGIDCFSLAGLKEFWVYIWALNGKLFPPKQDTYPITRGITVEIAGIIIFTFFGILSQLRIWNIVQKRKEAKDLEKSDEERQRNEEESELGRQVEAEQAQEKEEWERIYGDKKGTKKKKDSVISTEAKSTEESSASIETNEMGEVEGPEALPSGSERSSVDEEHNGRQIIVPVAADDITPAITDDSQARSPYWTNPTTSAATSVSSVHRDKEKTKPSTKAKGPKVVPLPFTIPQSTEEQQEEVRQGSDSSLQNTQHNSEENTGEQPHYSPLEPSLNLPKRFSVLTSTSLEAQVDDFLHDPRLSRYLAESPTEDNPESDHLVSAHEASIDQNEEADAHREASVPRSPAINSGFGQRALSQADSLVEESDELRLPASEIASLSGASQNHLEDTLKEQLSQHWFLQSENKPRSGQDFANAPTGEEPEEETHQVPPSDDAVELVPPAKIESPEPEVSKDIADKEESQEQSHGLLQRMLSTDKASKVVMQFRTNEWAKHLATAEKPTLEELAPIVPIVEEPASTVNEEELLKTALTAEPAPADIPLHEPPVTSPPKRRSHRSKQGPGQATGSSSRDSVQRPRPEVLRSVSASSRVGSKRSLSHRESKRPSVRSPYQTSRNSLLALPITEDVVASFPSPNPSPSSQNVKGATRSGGHGMARRSFTDPSPRPAPCLPYSSASPQMISPNADIAAALSNENLPLSQRRSYLRQSSSDLSLNAPAPSQPFSTQQARLEDRSQGQQQTIPEHTLQRAQMLAEWRRSKAMEAQTPPQRSSSTSPMNANPTPYGDSGDHNVQTSGRQSIQGPPGSWNQLGGTGMSSPPPNMGIGKGMVDSTIYSGKNRLSRRTSGMSAREVDNAHREVLRRMQAGANKALAQEGR